MVINEEDEATTGDLTHEAKSKLQNDYGLF